MRAWKENAARTCVSTMADKDFFSSEQSHIMTTADSVKITLTGKDGSVKVLKEGLELQAGEVIDATRMNAAVLKEFFVKEISDCYDNKLMMFLHMKATMMKVSDPIIFGHCVKAFYSDVLAKHGSLFDELNVNVNNGIGDVYDKIKGHPMEEEIKANIMKQYETRPGLAMFDSNAGITNLHVPSDVIIDASIPNVTRDGGQMWNKDYKLEEVKCEIISEGTITVTDPAGNKIFEHAVQNGDIWRMCQVKETHIQDWVKLAVSRAKATGAKAVFWLDPTRAHDADLISLVRKYLANHDTTGCDIEFLKPDDAYILACDRASEGLDTINCTGNMLRDYLTDIFPIHKVDTVCKRSESAKMELEPEDASEQEDSIPQLDGGADPVSCNICHREFEGRNKCRNLTSHKITEHFKDAFRREVLDETRIEGFYHCKEENCNAKHRQKLDMFRHLATVHDYIRKFSNRARSISHSASNAPAPGTEKISDLNTQPGCSHQQEQVATTSSDGMRSTAEINQGI